MSTQEATKSIHDHNAVKAQTECIQKHRDSRAARRQRLKLIKESQPKKQAAS